MLHVCIVVFFCQKTKSLLEEKKEEISKPEIKPENFIVEQNKLKKTRSAKIDRKPGPKFTVIGGKKVDLNSEKPQYLKLTLEQIQQLALQQKSGQLEILVFVKSIICMFILVSTIISQYSRKD